MSVDLLKIADILEKTAAVLDTHEAEKTAAVKAARENALKLVSSRYSELTGEEMPGDVLNKLASSDEDVLSTVQKMIEKTASSTGVESMGGAGEPTNEVRQPRSKKEAAQNAWDRFGSFILS